MPWILDHHRQRSVCAMAFDSAHGCRRRRPDWSRGPGGAHPPPGQRGRRWTCADPSPPRPGRPGYPRPARSCPRPQGRQYPSERRPVEPGRSPRVPHAARPPPRRCRPAPAHRRGPSVRPTARPARLARPQRPIPAPGAASNSEGCSARSRARYKTCAGCARLPRTPPPTSPTAAASYAPRFLIVSRSPPGAAVHRGAIISIPPGPR